MRAVELSGPHRGRVEPWDNTSQTHKSGAVAMRPRVFTPRGLHLVQKELPHLATGLEQIVGTLHPRLVVELLEHVLPRLQYLHGAGGASHLSSPRGWAAVGSLGMHAHGSLVRRVRGGAPFCRRQCCPAMGRRQTAAPPKSFAASQTASPVGGVGEQSAAAEVP